MNQKEINFVKKYCDFTKIPLSEAKKYIDKMGIQQFLLNPFYFARTKETYKNIRTFYELYINYKLQQQILTVDDLIEKFSYLSLLKMKNPFEQESAVITYISSKNNSYEILKVEEVARGEITASLIPAQTIIRNAVKYNSDKIIFTHNHPSGNTNPSEKDFKVSEKLLSGLDYFGIEVVSSSIVSPSFNPNTSQLDICGWRSFYNDFYTKMKEHSFSEILKNVEFSDKDAKFMDEFESIINSKTLNISQLNSNEKLEEYCETNVFTNKKCEAYMITLNSDLIPVDVIPVDINSDFPDLKKVMEKSIWGNAVSSAFVIKNLNYTEIPHKVERNIKHITNELTYIGINNIDTIYVSKDRAYSERKADFFDRCRFKKTSIKKTFTEVKKEAIERKENSINLEEKGEKLPAEKGRSYE